MGSGLACKPREGKDLKIIIMIIIIVVITSTIHKGVRQDIPVITEEVAALVDSLVTMGLETCSASRTVAIGTIGACSGSGSLIPTRSRASAPLGS